MLWVTVVPVTVSPCGWVADGASHPDRRLDIAATTTQRLLSRGVWHRAGRRSGQSGPRRRSRRRRSCLARVAGRFVSHHFISFDTGTLAHLWPALSQPGCL